MITAVQYSVHIGKLVLSCSNNVHVLYCMYVVTNLVMLNVFLLTP